MRSLPTANMAMPVRLRFRGNQMRSSAPTIQRIDGHGSEKPPTTRRWRSAEKPPPGEDRTNRAIPDRMKLAANVTTMSGMPDTVMTTPMSVDRAMAMAMTTSASATHVPRLCPSIQRAARQLVNTIMEPTERSMPPEITMMDCAMARKARLIVPAVMVRTSKAPNLGTCEARQNSSDQQQQGHAHRPALPPDEAGQPAGGLGEGGDRERSGRQRRGRRHADSWRPWAAVSSEASLAVGGNSATMTPLCSTAARSHTSPTSRSSLVNITMAAPPSARSRTRS